MSKHTPGPWVVRDDTDIIQFEGSLLATAGIGGKTRWENKANARLIASAPKLLESLQETLPMLELFLQINGEPEEGSVVYKARAAINNATGE